LPLIRRGIRFLFREIPVIIEKPLAVHKVPPESTDI